MKYELITMEGNTPVLSSQVKVILDNYFEAKEKFEKEEEEFRAALLQAMIENNITSTKLENYSISQVIPKPVVNFDKEKFVENVDVDTLSLFTTIKETFNLEKFKLENPELYSKYCDTEAEVDLSKLEKLRPDLYHNYISIQPNDKKITLRIAKGKK